jgi:hypothetical protein
MNEEYMKASKDYEEKRDNLNSLIRFGEVPENEEIPQYSRETYEEMIEAYEEERKAWQKLKSISKW